MEIYNFCGDRHLFSLVKRLSADHLCVMEAMGCYHQHLAIYLYELGIRLNEEGVNSGEFHPMDVKVATHIVVSSLARCYEMFLPDGKETINPVELENEFMSFIFGAIRALEI